MSQIKWGNPLMILALFTLCALMAIFPEASWMSAVRGLSIWWDVLFPSLFPFFVISEVLLGLGIVHFLGTLLDPLMKPLFRIPGSGGFVAAMGFAAGYPVSARLTAKLREQKLVSREEGERLVAFTTSSDPIFLIGAVSVGFFHSPQLALILALAHYGGSVIIGLVMRYHGRAAGSSSAADTVSSGEAAKSGRFSFGGALRVMHQARMEDGRDLGELMRQAVSSSLKLMTVVGGLVVFFSVFLELLTASGFIQLLLEGLRRLLPVLGLPEGLASPLIGGTFEVTLGAKSSAAAQVPFMFQAAAAAFILSWGGLSVHAQVASILNSTDLRYAPFLIARFIHAFLSSVIILLLWPLFGAGIVIQSASSLAAVPAWTHNWHAAAGNSAYFYKGLLFLLILSGFAILIQRLFLGKRPGEHK
ncbi:sporulation integral membrane protein YlbJ [Paenibacillus sp. CAA11]|uniref:sporulation integral membrane protein YlbJ n=1 Tax=Paenibacillus sp. CAA11 TaxID=1532905 RepID=UPI000D39E516|nr:sporulation integral membrane protein YlbJ [Paenibacillus sp. CAA11]AWB45910.1 sporulation integral membrane protein YlbJ [Paenibacillus sp. CAA11]